jgi:hypothetical protein
VPEGEAVAATEKLQSKPPQNIPRTATPNKAKATSEKFYRVSKFLNDYVGGFTHRKPQAIDPAQITPD